MPFDGLFLRAALAEVRQGIGARADKIYLPNAMTVVLVLRGTDFSGRVCICADPGAPRLFLTGARQDNPAEAPAFCMLLRKALGGARLVGIDQPGCDRVAALRFETRNEMGDEVERALRVELTGRTTNIILTEGERIIDALRRVDLSMSERPILPGGRYEPPTGQDKAEPMRVTAQALAAHFREMAERPVKEGILAAVSGFSPLLAREAAVRAGYAAETRCEEVDAARIADEIRAIGAESENNSHFCVLRDEARGAFDFSFTEIRQYDGYARREAYPSAGALLDAYYAEREREALIRARGDDLKKAVKAAVGRLTRKMEAQRGELAAAREKDGERRLGDLITANIYRIRPGDASLTATDYETGEEMTVALDTALSPAANAQRHYKVYRKARTAVEHLEEELLRGAQELEYLNSVAEEIARAASAAELQAVREELGAGGYIRAQKGSRAKQGKLLPHRFFFCGTEILAGRNNLQNEELTLRQADKRFTWLHVKDAPGAHVIVCAAEPEEEVLLFAACVAAYLSGSEGAKTAVDLTAVRLVKKQPGGRPGMVNYTGQRTVYVTPAPEEIEKARQ